MRVSRSRLGLALLLCCSCTPESSAPVSSGAQEPFEAPPDLPEPRVEPEAPEPQELVSSQPDLPFLGTEQTHDSILRELLSGRVEGIRPISGEPLVFDLSLAGSKRALLFPARPNQEEIPLVVVGSYRIARILQLPNAIPAVTRQFSEDELSMLDEDFVSMWSELSREMSWSDGKVLGAVTYLSPVRELGLGRRRDVDQWSEVLGQGGEVPEGQELLYRDLSDLVLLDYIVGNTQRVGGAVYGNPDGTRLLFNAPARGFPETFVSHEARRHRRHLRRTTKFSGRTLRRLTRLSVETLRSELAHDAHAAELSDAQVWGVIDRAQTALSYAVGLRDVYGEERVLPFD